MQLNTRERGSEQVGMMRMQLGDGQSESLVGSLGVHFNVTLEAINWLLVVYKSLVSILITPALIATDGFHVCI